MAACVFCEIVAGREPASVFHEDADVIGFMTIEPVNPGHALIVPKRHCPLLEDLEPELGRRIWTVAQQTAAAIRRSGLRCEGVNFFLADGEAAFQEVDHFHLHVFPRFSGDAFRLEADWSLRPSRSALDAAAERIRTALPPR